MKISQLISITILSIFVLQLACGASENFYEIQSYKCLYPKGESAFFQREDLKIEEDKFSNPIFIDSIHIKLGKARMIGNLSASDVHAFVSPNAINFIEITKGGSFNLTTIFNYTTNGGAYFSVMSRHTVGTSIIPPFVSQFYGYCEEYD